MCRKVAGAELAAKVTSTVVFPTQDETDIVSEFGLEHMLTAGEQQLIYEVYVEGHSVADLAKKQNRTRQAVNQQRIRAINKIKNCL